MSQELVEFVLGMVQHPAFANLFGDPEGCGGYDNALDVVGVHFVGGVGVGVLLIGLLATKVMTDGPSGLFYGGGFTQLIDRVLGFHVTAEDETTGVDFSQHAETAYAEGVLGHASARRATPFGTIDDQSPRRDPARDT